MIGVWTKPSEEREGGLSVIRLLVGGPAAESGVRRGDVIVAIDGHELDEPLDDEAERGLDDSRDLPEQRLRALVQSAPEGHALEMTVLRDGETTTLRVTPKAWEFGELALAVGSWMDSLDLDVLGEPLKDLSAELRLRIRDEELGARIREELERWRDEYHVHPRQPRVYSLDTIISDGVVALASGGGAEVRLRRGGGNGLEMVDVNPGLGSYFGTDEGVLIADVEEDSPLGLMPGDVVISVDGRLVDDVDELRRILGSYAHDENIVFRIRRDGAETSVEGSIS